MTSAEINAIKSRIASLTASKRHSSEVDVIQALRYLDQAYQRPITDEDARLKASIWYDALSDIEPETLSQAVREAVRICKFPPSVAEIREIAGRMPMTARDHEKFRLEMLLLKTRNA